MFEKEQESTPCPGEEAANTEEAVRITHTHTLSDFCISHESKFNGSRNACVHLTLLCVCVCSCVKQGDASKAKTKVWQNKSKGAKKTAKSKKKKLTKKKATPVPAKTKQANGNVAGNVRVQQLCIVMKLQKNYIVPIW